MHVASLPRAVDFARDAVALEGTVPAAFRARHLSRGLAWSARWPDLDARARADVAVGLHPTWLAGADPAAHLDALDEAAAGVRSVDLGRAAALEMRAALACFLRGDLEASGRRSQDCLRRLPSPETPTPGRQVSSWPPAPAAVARDLQIIGAAVARESGAPEQGLHQAERALAHARAADDALGCFRAEFHVAAALLRLERPDEAAAEYRRLVKAGLRFDAAHSRTLAFANLGLAATIAGDREAGLAWLEESADRLELRGEWLMLGKVRLELARLSGRRADLVEARDLAERCADAETLARASLRMCAGLSRPRARAHLEATRWTLEHLGATRQQSTLQTALRQLADPDLPRLRREGGVVWVHTSGGAAARIDLRRRPGLRRILNRLVAAAEQGDGVTAAQLVHAGWPGEAPTGDSGLNRVYTAIRTLRRLGLDEVLVRERGRYRLRAAPGQGG